MSTLSNKSAVAAEKYRNLLIDSGESLLGCIILNSNILYQADLTPEMFLGNTLVVFEACLTLQAKDQKVDIVSVGNELMHLDRRDLVTLPAELTEKVSTAANWRFFYDKLLQAYRFEQTRRLYTSSFEEFLESEDPVIAADTFTEGITRIQESATQQDFKTPETELMKCVADIEEAYKRKDPIVGLPTGIDEVDAFTLGLRKSTLTIIGARPSQGKTALALSIARHIALNVGPVGFLSGESPADQLMKRMISQESGVDLTRLISGVLSNSHFAKMSEANSRLYKSPLYVWDYAMTIPNIKSRARLLKNKFGIKVLFLDYIGSKIRQHKNYPNEREFIGDQSTTLADLSKELDIPVVGLSQLSRDSENRRPEMKDFYGSAQVEKDADTMIAIWHKNGLSSEPGHDPDSRLIFMKQRDGQTGEARVHFKRECVLFEDRRG